MYRVLIYNTFTRGILRFPGTLRGEGVLYLHGPLGYPESSNYIQATIVAIVQLILRCIHLALCRDTRSLGRSGYIQATGEYIRYNSLYMQPNATLYYLFGCRQPDYYKGIWTFIACIALITDTIEIGTVGSHYIQ